VRETSGYVYKDAKNGFWYARITYTERNGKRKDIKRHVENKAKGYQVLATLIEEVENGSRSIDADRMTFSDLSGFAASALNPKYVRWGFGIPSGNKTAPSVVCW
jgi:hypothetical protein